MIDINAFDRALATFRPPPNAQQWAVIVAGPRVPLFIVAGPGTGKTASLTLRILKLVLVDGIPPRGILATTFTKKAAGELRSRILSWGLKLVDALMRDEALSAEILAWLDDIDINQVVTGTTDSICEQLLRDFRDPGSQPPVMADDFVSKTLLLREGLFNERRDQDQALDDFLFRVSGRRSTWGWHIGAKNDLVQQIWERRFQDQIRWTDFVDSGTDTGSAQALRLLGAIADDYHSSLTRRGMLDFALLEQQMLARLSVGQPTEFLDQVQVILVDEYQDTNLLQESIYFEMARACNGALNVVGDDDQSLYRFRGATVELFSEFAERYAAVFGARPEQTFLRVNYRSTQRVIDIVDRFATLDDSYQRVRVAAKPALDPRVGAPQGVPILGMFRDDMGTLASDLADFINNVFREDGYRLPNDQVIQRATGSGDLGDCALLCSSPAELNSSGNPRLPLLLRNELRARNMETFNPRGQDLTDIPIIMRFGGLLLECLDPGGVIEEQTSGLNNDIIAVFTNWREAAIDFADSDEAPDGLLEFAIGWADRDPRRSGYVWPDSLPILDLVYGLVHFFPELHDDPEGQIYLEIFTRQVSACEQVGKFSARVVQDSGNQDLTEASAKELLRDFLGPIASGTIRVNEELMEAFPRDRLSILSIHQSKGLEFPLMIVDAGSDFRSNHAAHRFKRFPANGSTAHTLEDTLRPYCDLGAPRRTAVDRAFDDLYRQFFVAYSRAQQALLIVGNRRTFPGQSVPNVATGWDRQGNNLWAGNVPFIEI